MVDIVFDGSITLSQTAGVIGTTTNNDADALSVGEYVESVIAAGSSVTLTTGEVANITSISLTAGDWDVFGSWVTAPASGTTSSNRQGAINTTSATLPAGQYVSKSIATLAGTENDGFAVPMQRLSLSGTTTVYLVGFSTFAVSTMAMYGFIGARRVR